LRRALRARLAPWSFILGAGLPLPLTITLQGLLIDTLAPTPIVSTTNAVVLDVR
jgi:hypothetical protein